MQRKAFVLLSGGLDSTTCLYKAVQDYGLAEAVSINYGQKHIKETEYAARTCKILGINHTVLDLGGLLSGEGVMLTDPSVEIPNKSYSDIRGVSPTYVPFRNGTMLSAITALAQKYVMSEISRTVDEWTPDAKSGLKIDEDEATKLAKDLCGVYFGAHSEDAQNFAYPDCTPEFIGSMCNAIYIGSYMTIRLHTPLQWLMKKDIVKLGHELSVPFGNTWSCYAGKDLHCGTCPTCRSRREAFIAAGVHDPTEYAA